MKVVVGYDGSEHARRALERAAGFAQDGERVTVVSAAHRLVTTGRGPGIVADPAEIEERKRNLAEAASFLAERGVDPDLVEAHGDPGLAIVEEARDRGADLVVVGTRGRNTAERLLLGSVSSKVVHRAPCDVLVVK